jgi:hypothetical protein
MQLFSKSHKDKDVHKIFRKIQMKDKNKYSP